MESAVGINRVASFDQFQKLLNASNLSVEDLIDIGQDKVKFSDVKLKKKYRNNKKVVEYLNNLLGNRSILTLDDEDLYNDIKNNFSDKEIAQHIYKYVSGKLNYIYERAKEFRKTIFKTYYDFEDPQKIVRKANAYIEQLNLTPVEKTIFFSMFKDNKPIFLTGNKTFDKYEESTQIARLFNMKPEQSSLNLSESDKIFYDEIAKYHKSHEFIYNYNVRITCEYIREYQKYTNYKEFTTGAIPRGININNSFNDFCNKYFNDVEIIQKYKYTNCVHPVIFILFGIPIGILEFYFNIASIGRLITYSHDHKKLTYFDKLIRTKMAESKDLRINSQGKNLSTIEDMFYRVKIQYALWKQVLLLRSKFFMSCDSTNFYNLLSVYSPNIFLDSKGDITSDSINIISKLFSIINFKPITLQIVYEAVKDSSVSDDQKGNAITIFKKGRDDFYYAMNLTKEMIRNIETGAEEYYKGMRNKTIKRSFIYVVMQDGSTDDTRTEGTKDNILGMQVNFSKSKEKLYHSDASDTMIYNMVIDPIHTNIASKGIVTVTDVKKKYFINRTKKYILKDIEGVLIFIVIRNQNPIKKRSYINFTNEELEKGEKEFASVIIENDTEISDFNNKPLFIRNLNPTAESTSTSPIDKLTSDTISGGVPTILGNIVGNKHFILNSFLSYSCRKITTDNKIVKGNPFGVIYNKDGYTLKDEKKGISDDKYSAKYLMYRPFDYKKTLSESVDSVLFYNSVDSTISDKDKFFYQSLVNYSEIIIYVDTSDTYFDLNKLSNLDHIEQ